MKNFLAFFGKLYFCSPFFENKMPKDIARLFSHEAYKKQKLAQIKLAQKSYVKKHGLC